MVAGAFQLVSTAFSQMSIVKQIIAILGVSFSIGIAFNMWSPRGIDILSNPWSTNNSGVSVMQAGQVSQVTGDEPIVFIGRDRACQFFDNQEGIILDARSREEYTEGHITGAHHLCFYNMSDCYPGLEELIKESPAILVYCGNVNCDDSEFLANELLNLGHEHILVYKGGFNEWKANNLPIEKGASRSER